MDLKHYDKSIGRYMDEVSRGYIDIAKLNRPFEWKNDVPLKFAEVLLDGLLTTNILLWDQSSINNNEDTVNYINIQDMRHNVKVSILRSLVIDGGHRTLCLYAWLTGNLINIGNGDFKGRGRDIDIAFNPLIRKFQYIKNLTKKDKFEWIYPMRDIWRDLVDVDDEDYEERTEEVLERFYNNSAQVQIISNYSDDEKETIKKNIKKLVKIPKRQIGINEIPARATLKQISDSFINTNEGEKVSLSRKLLSRMVVNVPKISDKYVDFYETNYDPFLLSSQEDLPVVAVTILTYSVGKDAGSYTSVMLPENIHKFEDVSNTLLYEPYFRDFDKYISSSFGIKTPSARKQPLHVVLSIYYNGLYLFPNIDKNKFRAIIKKLFFSLVILPRCFRANSTDQAKIFFSNQLKDITCSEEYMKYVLAFSTNSIFKPNMVSFKDYITKPDFDKNGKAKKASNHPFTKVQRAILYYKNAIVPFVANSKFSNFRDSLDGHHINPRSGSYKLEISNNLGVLENPMNILLIPDEVNGRFGNQKPNSYFNIELEKNHTEVEIEELLNQHCLDVGYNWLEEEPTIKSLNKFFERRGERWVNCIEDFYYNIL